MTKEQRSTIHSIHEAKPGDAFAVPAEQLERVIARASVLQHAAGEGEQRQLSEEEIIAIGREVGLEPEHVRRALAEYRAEALSPTPPDDHPLLARHFGQPFARVRRVMRGDPQDIHLAFERHLRSEESMRAIRRHSTASVWEPDSSWKGKLSRALNLEGRSFEISQLKSFSISTAPASPNESLVIVTADLKEERTEQIQGWGFSLGALTAIAFVGAAVEGLSVWYWMLIMALAASVSALGAFAIRTSMDNRRRRAALLLEGLLDQLEYTRNHC